MSPGQLFSRRVTADQTLGSPLPDISALVCSTAYASFGGLLMALTGAYRHVSSITVGDNVYLLARQ